MATIALDVTVEPDNSPPRIQIDVTDSGTPAITSVTVTRTDNSGVVTPVRTADGGPLTLTTSGSDRVGTLYDYEAPYGIPVTYSTVEYPAEVTAEVTLDSDDVWLVHPGVPDWSRVVSVAELGETVRPVNRGVFRPLGRGVAVTVTDGRRGSPEGTLTLRTYTDQERRDIDALIDDAGVLLLNVPPALGWGVDACYVSFGDSTETRLIDYAGEPGRYFAFPYIVVARPAGGTQSQWTWADVIATYPTWLDVLAANATWADLQAPTF